VPLVSKADVGSKCPEARRDMHMTAIKLDRAPDWFCRVRARMDAAAAGTACTGAPAHNCPDCDGDSVVKGGWFVFCASVAIAALAVESGNLDAPRLNQATASHASASTDDITTTTPISETAKAWPTDAAPLRFHGDECTADCSGHEAGYAWAEEHGIDDPDDCDGNSLVH